MRHLHPCFGLTTHIFKGLRQCADPLKWWISNRGYEERLNFSTAEVCVLEALRLADFKWLAAHKYFSFGSDSLPFLILTRCQCILESLQSVSEASLAFGWGGVALSWGRRGCRLGASGGRRGGFFRYLWGFLDRLVGFLAVSGRLGRGLGASWERRGSVLEASWGVYMEFFPICK